MCAQALERFFVVLSYNGKENIDFDEFLQAKYLLDHIPHEPLIQKDKNPDEVMTPEDIIYNDRLQLVFHLLDLNFNSLISMSELRKVMPSLMQDATIKEYNADELEEYNSYFQYMSELCMIQFDHSNTQQLGYRDFRQFAKQDLSIQELLKNVNTTKRRIRSI